ncbi:MAG: hypothetical protein CMM50_07115 [Rhodospirillaceae bacterium]|nr:hypothetical protein [Rhodospirillaceae bacterium]|tara:strand:- start:40 stop:369 length:330 start_codon:yes stop_codon:yes gene_type:complete
MPQEPTTYRTFWPYYLNEHRKPATRRLHFLGTGLGLALLALLALTGAWWLSVAALVSGYAFAWAGHFFVEKNRPATFRFPLWSLYSDFRMFALAVTGRLQAELRRYGVE